MGFAMGYEAKTDEPAAAVLVIILIRTALEDQTLQEELPAYREYAQRVRYRLMPGVY